MTAPAATPTKPPTWYWVVAVILTLWMAVGIAGFAVHLTMDYATAPGLSEAQRQLYTMSPAWLDVVYGLATVTGILGAVGLLMRKAWSAPALVTSLVFVIVQFGYWLVGLPSIELLGAAAAVTMPVVIVLMGAFAVWFARNTKGRGWIG